MAAEVVHCKPGDRDLFLSLWSEFLLSHEKSGSDMRESDRTLSYFGELFDAYVSGMLPGVVLRARGGGYEGLGVLLWGGLPEPPFDRVDERVVMGWGAYTIPEARRQGISQALRETAILELSQRGINSVTGSAILSNTPGIESSRKIQFKPTAILGTLNLHEEAQKIKLRRSGLAEAEVTDGFYWQGHCPLCGNDPQEEAT